MLRCRIVPTTITMIQIIQPKTGENNEPTSSTKAIPMGQRQSAPKMNNPNMKIFRVNLMVKIFSNYFMCACNVCTTKTHSVSSLTTIRCWRFRAFSLSLLYSFMRCLCILQHTDTVWTILCSFYLISTTPSAIPLRFHLFCDAFLLFGVFLLQNLTPLF